jgi:chromosome segregation ATPase
MIDDEEYSTFKFNGDDEPEPVPEEALYQEEARDRRIEKISHRVTIISVLIPVLLGVVFYITYRDITSRVSQSQDTGAMEIQNLSTQLEDQFEALSKKYGELETSLAQKLATLEKVDKSMTANLKQAQDMVSKINATKVDKKEQQDAIAKIDTALGPIRKELESLGPMRKELETLTPMRKELETLTPMRKQLEVLNPMREDLKTVTAALRSLDKDTQQQLSTLSVSVDKALNDLTRIQSEIQSDMSSLSDQKLNKDALQLELLKARKKYQRDLELTRLALDKRLSSILRKIRDLEKIAHSPHAATKPSGGTISSGSGKIIEQEIKE